MYRVSQLTGFNGGVSENITVPYVEKYTQQQKTNTASTYTWTNRDAGTDNARRVVVACVTFEGSNTNSDVTAFTIGGVNVYSSGNYIDRFRRVGSKVNSCAIGWAEVSGTTVDVSVTLDASQKGGHLVLVVLQDVNDSDSVFKGSGAGANVSTRSTALKDVVQDSVCIGIGSTSSANRTINDFETGSQNFSTTQTWKVDSNNWASQFGYLENVNSGSQDCTLVLDSSTDRFTLCAIWIN